MADDMKPLKVYTKEEAAAILRCTVSWLEKRAAKRLIPFTMLGGSYCFTDEHLAEIVRMFEVIPARAMRSSRRQPTVRCATGEAQPNGVVPLRAREKKTSPRLGA